MFGGFAIDLLSGQGLDFRLPLLCGPRLVDIVLEARKADWSRTLVYL